MKSYSNFSDVDLIILLKHDDGYAYTEIFERYNEILLRHAYRILTDKDEINDVVQDVFLTLWQKRSTIEFKVSLLSYLSISVRNRIFDLLSHKKIILKYAASFNKFLVEGYNITDDEIRERELSKIIEREIDHLPTKMKEVFLMNKKDGLSYKEIAAKLNITDQTAKQQVYKALKILKPKLDSFMSAFPFL
ncbi:RNA polymerase sigma factor [Pedobacter sp. 22163]|uniref:RNA polymerase sigma factor n=1 Tax=Pedobacter sp. 22163 TaxID=3453883 RepID=UPI003F8703E3